MATRDGPGRFAVLLRRHRAAAGLSQEELAERAGLSRRGISDLERGARRSPHPTTARRLAEALNLGLVERAALLASGHAETVAVLPPASFPVPRTSFVGRAGEVAEVRRLLGVTRLLTLTGPGGMGKTRLAIEAARSSADVAFVDLAPHEDGRLVATALAAALGVHEQPRVPLLDLLTASLASRSALLVLDNCEHLVTACAELADHLLRACPRLRVLATSRQPLAVAGEQLWPVVPLSVRGATASHGADSSEAARLFAERARLVQHDFEVDERNTASVAELCRRLDGVPLAIELAAARVRVLTVEQIAARLDDRFRLLTGGSPTGPPRQRTLRAAIDWSHDLLSAAERVLLRRVAAFSGGWTLEAAEAVCAGDGLDRGDVVDLLTGLTDKSLVLVDEHDGAARYRLLETIRAYAAERLAADGDEPAARRAHAEFFRGLAQRAEVALRGPEQVGWTVRLMRELDNLRAALRWTLVEGRIDTGLQLASDLHLFWLRRSPSEGSAWVTELLRHPAAPAGGAARAKALVVAGTLGSLIDGQPRARALVEDGLAEARRCRAAPAVVAALLGLGAIERGQGEYGAARAAFEEGLDLARDLDDEWSVGRCLFMLGEVASMQRHHRRWRALVGESVQVLERVGDPWASGYATRSLAFAAYQAGDLEAARAGYEVATRLAQRGGDEALLAWTLWGSAVLALALADGRRATELLRDAVALFHGRGERAALAHCLDLAAGLAAARDEPRQALRAAGAAGALRRSLGHVPSALARADAQRWLKPARRALRPWAQARAREDGSGLTPEQAIAEVLGVS